MKLPSGQTSKPLNIRAWEDFSFESETIQTNIPKDVIQKFLHIHWCWIAPMFMWVYRPAFVSKWTKIEAMATTASKIDYQETCLQEGSTAATFSSWFYVHIRLGSKKAMSMRCFCLGVRMMIDPALSQQNKVFYS